MYSSTISRKGKIEYFAAESAELSQAYFNVMHQNHGFRANLRSYLDVAIGLTLEGCIIHANAEISEGVTADFYDESDEVFFEFRYGDKIHGADRRLIEIYEEEDADVVFFTQTEGYGHQEFSRIAGNKEFMEVESVEGTSGYQQLTAYDMLGAMKKASSMKKSVEARIALFRLATYQVETHGVERAGQFVEGLLSEMLQKQRNPEEVILREARKRGVTYSLTSFCNEQLLPYNPRYGDRLPDSDRVKAILEYTRETAPKKTYLRHRFL